MAENILEEKWVKGIAITTTILAVVAAIAASRSSYFVAQSQLLTACCSFSGVAGSSLTRFLRSSLSFSFPAAVG